MIESMNPRRGVLLIGVLASIMWAEEAPPRGIVRGSITAWEGSDARGTFSLQTDASRVVRCGFDSKSYMERDHTRIMISSITPLEIVEVLVDSSPEIRCRALILRVLPPPNSRPAYGMHAVSTTTRAIEWFAPRGNLTFGGVIVVVRAESMVLRTRRDGDKAFVLRKDTRYTADGTPTDSRDLRVNTPVYIRAGRNLDNQLEAYSVSWGEILKP
jgi:hypothetical protein